MATRGYEQLLDEYAAYTPYGAFEAEAGMRKGADIRAVKAGLTQKLRRAEPEGATSSYYVPGQRGSALMNYGALAKEFGARRGELAAAQGRVAGDVESREHLFKQKYIYENLLDNLDAEKATIVAEHEYHQGIMKGVVAAATTGIAAATGVAKIAKKYDAMQPTPEEPTPEEQIAKMKEEMGIAEEGDRQRARYARGIEAEGSDFEDYVDREYPAPKIESKSQTEIARYKGLQPQLEQGTEAVTQAAEAMSQAESEVDAAQEDYDRWKDKAPPPAYGEDPDDMSGKGYYGRRVANDAAARLNRAVSALDDARARYNRILRAYAVMGGYEESLGGGLEVKGGRLVP